MDPSKESSIIDTDQTNIDPDFTISTESTDTTSTTPTTPTTPTTSSTTDSEDLEESTSSKITPPQLFASEQIGDTSTPNETTEENDSLYEEDDQYNPELLLEEQTLPSDKITQDDMTTELESTIDKTPTDDTENIEEHILDVDIFEEGDSVILLSLNSKNKYHKKIVDFLYIEQNNIVLLDNQTDDILELSITDNKIDINDNKIYSIQKKEEKEKKDIQVVIKKTLEDIETIESGIEIQERLLSVWERQWSENEYIQSIIETLKKTYKNKSYYDLDNISKDLLELINDNSKIIKNNSNLIDEDNKELLLDILTHKYTHNLIKPIVLDKKKIYTKEDQKIMNPGDAGDKYQKDNSITLLDTKQNRLAQDSLNKRSLLHTDNVRFSSNELSFNHDTYENELVNGRGETIDLSEYETIPKKGNKTNDTLRPNIPSNLDTFQYDTLTQPFINTDSDFDYEFFLMSEGLEYKTKVYRPIINYKILKEYNKQDIFTSSNDIQSRIADNNYYRYRDILDKRRITDSFGRVKSSQICHGIKAEYNYSGSSNRKQHKDSFFNKSITRLPKKHKYIDGESLHICGLVIHNVDLYFPNFIETQTYMDDSVRLHYKTNDEGYNIYDYVIQNQYNTKNIDNLYTKIYDISQNSSIYNSENIDSLEYNKNNFIYFNANKTYSTTAVVNDIHYTLKLNNKTLSITNTSTNNTDIKDINDSSIKQNFIDSLISSKLIYVDSTGKNYPLKNKLKEEQYLQSIRKIIPSVKDIFNYELEQTTNTNTLHKSYNVKDINKILSKYKLTYKELPAKYRDQLADILEKNIVSYKQQVRNDAYITKYKKNNNIKIVQKIYHIFDYMFSKLGYKQIDNENIKKYVNLYQYYFEYILDPPVYSPSDEDKIDKKNFHNEIILKIQEIIKRDCEIHTLKSFTDEDLYMFLIYITNHSKKYQKGLSRKNIIYNIVDILCSKYNTVYYKNFFFNDITQDSYQSFCLRQEPGVTTHYCSKISLDFLTEFYKYNSLELYNKYESNTSITLQLEQFQLIEMLTLFKKNKKYELLFDIYKNIQIERELQNINHFTDKFYKQDSDVFISLDDEVERLKRQFMRLREKFNDEIRKLTYYDACYGFKIVKVYNKKYDLLKDNINDQVYYDSAFDTTQDDIDIINEYIQQQSLNIAEIEYIQQIENIYTLFKKYYVFSPEYEIKNIVHNAIRNIRNNIYEPKKNSKGLIIINYGILETTPIVWEGIQYSLDKEGTMTSEEHTFNINELQEETVTIPTGLIINTYKLLNYLDSLNIIVIDKQQSKRKVEDNDFCILKDKTKRFIYKRVSNSWVPLTEDEVKQKGSCLLDMYNLKNYNTNDLSLLEFDDLIKLESQDIIDFDLSLIDDSIESSSLEEQLKIAESSSKEGETSLQDELELQSEDVSETTKTSQDEVEESSERPIEADLGDLSDLFDLPQEQDSTSNKQDDQDTPTSVDVIKMPGDSENLSGGANVPVGERVDLDINIPTPKIEDPSFNVSNQCVNINSLPIKIKQLFDDETFQKEDGYAPTYDYKNVMVPKTFIKFIFDINKEFNKIKELDHIVYDNVKLQELLDQNTKHIKNKLNLMKKNYEERKDNMIIKEIDIKPLKKYSVPKNIIQEFNSIMSISDIDISLTKLKEFIDSYGIYYKPDCNTDTKIEVLQDEKIDEKIEDEEQKDGDADDKSYIQLKDNIDPEKEPHTSTSIYWDPYFFPNVCEKMCCKHYLDLTELAWLDNKNRNKKLKQIVKKYCITDHIEGGALHCKYCGHEIQTIDYSSQEGFSSDDTPLIFREIIDENEYQYGDDFSLENVLQDKHNFNEIIQTFMKLLNVKLTKKDVHFVKTSSYKMYSLYEKNQADIYAIYSRRYYDKNVNDKLLKKFQIFYDAIIQKNPNIQNIFNKKGRESYGSKFMNIYYKKVKSSDYLNDSNYKKLMKYNKYLLKQQDIYNGTMEICLVMIYFILIVFYSDEHYNIVSSGDARYTGQRVIIYDTLEQIKEKCIELSLNIKKTASEKSLWNNFVNTEKIFKIEFLPEIKQSKQSSKSYYNSNIKTMLLDHYFNDLYNKIIRQSPIQILQINREKYNERLRIKEQIIESQPEWTTFRPSMTPDYNYRNDTALVTLETLMDTLQTTTSNKKIYTLLTSISEEIKKLSLEYISRINNYIILDKFIKNIHYISYQSSCCYFNIQQSYQDDMSEEIKKINQNIRNLSIVNYQNTNDYYLLNTYRGLNQQHTGRNLLDYFYMKDILHKEYLERQENPELSDSNKDEEYKTYLIHKIKNVHLYMVTEGERAGEIRNFIDINDTDSNMLSQINDTDDLETSLESLLREKYDSIKEKYIVSDDILDTDLYNTFIQNKIDVIINHGGETQMDTVTNMYIYELEQYIKSIIDFKTPEELKDIVEELYNFVEKNIKEVIPSRIEYPQYKKIFKRSYYQQEQQYIMTQHSKSLEHKVNDLFDDFDSVNMTNILENIIKQDIDITDSDISFCERKTKEKMSSIKGYVKPFINSYKDIKGFSSIITDSLNLSDIFDSLLFDSLGNYHLLEEYNNEIIENLIVQGYQPGSEMYNEEYDFRRRTIETNLHLQTIQTYNTYSKHIVIQFNKLFYLIKNKATLPSKEEDEEETTKIVDTGIITFSDMYTELEQMYNDFDIHFEDEKYFIIENTEELLELINTLYTIRDTYSIHNRIMTKNIVSIEFMSLLSKYIFSYILTQLIDANSRLFKPFIKYILFNILSNQTQINDTDKKIYESINIRKEELNEARKEAHNKLSQDMQGLKGLYRNINMGGHFSKRNEIDEQDGQDELQDSEQTVDLLDPQTVEDIEAQEQLVADMDTHREYSMSNVGGEDDHDEDYY